MLLTQYSLTILLWNANGLTNHRQELNILLHERRIDIALITETHFTERTRFYINDYKTYRTDHPDGTAHGGSAILIKNSLTHFLIPSNATYSLQPTVISLQSEPFNYTIAAVYCPPNQTINQNQFLSFFQFLGTRFISGGDYNAKHPRWGSRVANPRGRVLYNALSQTNFSYISPSQPTYWPAALNKRPDLLDFFICSNISSFHTDAFTLDDLSSDHSPVILTIDIHPRHSPPKPTLINGPIDWDSFRDILEQKIDLKTSLKTPQQLDDTVYNFTTAIQQSIRQATTNCTTTRTERIPYNLPLYIRSLITKKRRARSLWQHTRYPSHKQQFNQLTRKLKNELHNFYNNQYAEYTKSLTTDDNSLWTATRRILKFQHTSSPLRSIDDTWAKSAQEKAELFATHLSSVFIPHLDIQDLQHTTEVNAELDAPLPLSLPPKAFTPTQVKQTINNLPKKKSPGYDLITAQVLHQLPKKAIVFLTTIYNSILRTTYYPILWKFSNIKMIPKPGKPTHQPSSYRPISLLPILGKIFERLLLPRLLETVETMKILPNHQFGFRSRHSTIQQAHRVVDTIATSLELKEFCAGVFLDISQAFDRVWHEGLLLKLKQILPSTYYLILNSYLSERFFQVIEGTSQSSIHPILAGVPQGSVLAPLLYSVYTSDLPTHPSTSMYTFADDTAILSTNTDPTLSVRSLQTHLHSLEPWLQKWRIKINPHKSKYIVFTLKRKILAPVYLYNSSIPLADHVRYLGLYLDKRLT
uniref:Putative reverse transcriptase n=1 Tax=Panstrongylus lignarius TaxID=156445 RepID=A0A224X7Z3_9HEMI